jgi:hypothetical protein
LKGLGPAAPKKPKVPMSALAKARFVIHRDAFGDNNRISTAE